MGGYVYLICDPANDTYKIGVTRNIQSKRIKKLQTGNSTELHIVHTFFCEYPFRLEKMLHAYFLSKHELNEWYNLETSDVFNFLSICDNLTSQINSLKDNIFFMKNIK